MKRIALITGASRGIGYQTALAMAKDSNYKVIAVARNAKRLQKLKDEVASQHENTIHTIEGDITHSAFRSDLVKVIKNTYGHLNVLVNNAGVLINKVFEEVTEEEVQKQFDVNVFAPLFLTQALIPLMIADSHTIFISSMGGFQGSLKFPGLAAYSSAKGAVAILTECLAEEYKGSGYFFNCLALGAVQTEMLQEAFPGFKAEVSPQKMGEYITYFALNGHNFYNGKVIPVSLNTP